MSGALGGAGAAHAPGARAQLPATLPPPRDHGWTPARQRLFLEAIAAGHSVVDACRLVGLSHQSAYAFRQRAASAAFALGWQAAQLIARQHLADTLYVRAIEGQVETITRADGSTWERHRFDNRLAATMLARLDRFADGGADGATRHVAQRFEAFLESLPDQCLADADGIVRSPQLPQPTRNLPPPAEAPAEAHDPELPVWWCPELAEWRTHFPPPPDFDGVEDGVFGAEDYERNLDSAEAAIMDAPFAIELGRRVAAEGMARDAWFAAHLAALDADADDPACAGAGDGERDGEGDRQEG